MCIVKTEVERILGSGTDLVDLGSPPGRHDVDGEAVLELHRVAELPLLELAAGLERTVKHLDAPVRGVPAYAPGSVVQAVHSRGACRTGRACICSHRAGLRPQARQASTTIAET